MPTVTTAELVERAMSAADMHDSFVTPRQWMYWASQERLALDLFVARNGWTQAFEQLTLTPTGSESGLFTLAPADGLGLMAIVTVHQLTTQGYRRLIHRDFPAFTHGITATGTAQEYTCKRVNDSLRLTLYPYPTAGETYVVTYVPHPARLTLDTSPATGYANSVSYPMGWEDRIVLGMARRALDKEESDSTPIQRQVLQMDQQIEQLCWDRVMADGPGVINTDVERRGWTDRLSYPPAVGWWWA